VIEHALIDELRWRSDESVRLELPIHAELSLQGAGEWQPGTLDGGGGMEDGFSHVHSAMHLQMPARVPARLVDVQSGEVVAWAVADLDCEWWSAVAPGASGAGNRKFLVARMQGATGRIRTVWSWSHAVRDVSFPDEEVAIELADGRIVEYKWREDGARIHTLGTSVTLAGFREKALQPCEPAPAASAASPTEYPLPLARDLGEHDYRASEPSWSEAGSPRARVVVDADARSLLVDVEVTKSPLVFRAADAPDPALDNEHPDINSDGVQLHLWSDGWPEPAAWLVVPERGDAAARVRQTAGGTHAPPVTATWRETAAGYAVRLVVPRASLAPVVAIDVLVNDMAPDRVRRRGQLVLSGARGERVYLRGDRQPRERLLQIRLPP
jgi:hypothetical protein